MTLHASQLSYDFIANIGQQQNIGQGKFYWPSGPYTVVDTGRHESVDECCSRHGVK